MYQCGMNYSLDGFTQDNGGFGFVELTETDLCFMDEQTIRCLELLENNLDSYNRRQSLFGYLNANTSTTIGQRLLRDTITRPLCHLPSIQARLDCIEYLLERHDTLALISKCIKRFANGVDLDNFISSISNLCRSRLSSSRHVEQRLEAIAIVENMIVEIENLSTILEDNDQTTLNLCRAALRDPAFKGIQEVINDILVPPNQFTRRRHDKLSRIKEGVDSLFDVARASYDAALDDIKMYLDELQKDTGLHWRTNYTETRGYYLVLYLDRMPKGLNLSSMYINQTRSRQMLTCTTRELMKLNVRVKVSYENSLRLANELLFGTLMQIMDHSSTLTKVIEQVGLLDLTTSFAKLVSTSNGRLVRPKFNATDTIIEEGRHPVVESILELNKLQFVENDTRFKTKTNNFMLVTGPNMGGKSIYLKQVALIQIIAQIGCYVPAKSAHIKLMNRIVARSGIDSDNRSNCSSFMWEMKGMASVLAQDETNKAESVLYIIDEVGRGTSVDCGASYSFTISEELCLRENCFTLFATHYDQVFCLTDLYKNIKPYHFEYEVKHASDGTATEIKTNHRLLCDEAEKSHYGINLAQLCGIPEEIIKIARQEM